MISQTVLSKGLDSGTAFEILSIDIADVDIGKTSGPNYKLNKHKRIKTLRKQKLRNVVQWL